MSTDLLNIGKSGLFTAKQSMSTTSHNIANANTEGFTRQEVKTENAPAKYESSFVVGTGVEIQSIKRSHDDMVEKNSTSLSQIINLMKNEQISWVMLKKSLTK